MNTLKKFKIAAIASHVVQYQAPFFRFLALCPEIDLTVFFCSNWGLSNYSDEGFGKNVKWDIKLLGDYHSEFLTNISPTPNPSRFLGLINPEIVQKLKDGKFDAVWLHGWASITNLLAMGVAFNCNLPVLLRGESNLLAKPTPLKSKLRNAVLSLLFKKISCFLAIGTYNAEFYKVYGVPDKKIFFVPYAVDNNFFLSKADELIPQKNKLKEKFNIPINMPVILFSGKLTHVKRPMDLLEAYAQVLKEKDVVLVFVGDGLLRNDLEAFCSKEQLKYVYFVGFKNQTELPELYAIADIFVLPSSYEPWGLVVNEAMCFSLPVIVSDKVGAGGDLVQEGINGFIYPVKDVFLLTEKIKIILSDNELIKKMGKNSKELIKKWSYKEDLEGILKCLTGL